MRFSRVVLPFVLLAAFSGCGGKTKEAGPSSEPAPSAPGGGDAAPALDKFRIGRDQGPDGTVQAETDHLLPSERLFVSFVVRDPWKETQVKVTWRNLGTTGVVSEETKPLPASGPISFEAKGAGTWERGGYRLEISLASPGRPSGVFGSKDFELVAKR